MPFAAMRALAGAPLLLVSINGSILAGQPDCDLVAALDAEGDPDWFIRAQDYESAFDVYDIFAIEDFVLDIDTLLLEVFTFGFCRGDSDGFHDFDVRVFENNATGLPGQDSYTGDLVAQTVPGTGIFDLSAGMFLSSFEGQCVPAGSYFLVYAVRADFGIAGSCDIWAEHGEHSVGGGEPDNGWQWNPGQGFGMGTHFRPRDGNGDPLGIVFAICGEPGVCSTCPDPTDCGDFDDDGDSDGDDFFAFLDAFAQGDPCADLDADGDIDGDDFFLYLDHFVRPCD